MIGIGLLGLLELIAGVWKKLFGPRLSAEERRRLEDEERRAARRLGLVVMATVIVGLAEMVLVTLYLEG